MVAALAMWLITSSPFALMFAALGPVTALASLADSRIGSRRRAKRELARFERDTAALLVDIETAHAAERLASSEATPAARSIILRSGADPYRWRARADAAVSVAVGTGAVISALRLEQAARQAGDPPAVTAGLDRLAAATSTLEAAPVVVDARLGVGVIGPPRLACAAARAITLQLAWSLSPAEHWFSAADREAQWMSLLPHPPSERGPRPGAGAEFGRVGEDAPIVTVSVAETEPQLPSGCSVVIRAGGEGGPAIVQHPERSERRPIRIETVSLDEAVGWAAAVTLDAEREGLVVADSLIPTVVALGDLDNRGDGDERSLACTVAVDASGPVRLDLVAHGPHAVIGGTTGSGKSELLLAWVIAMAAAHPPERVNFLLIDFKGGSAFAALAALAHTVGIITDLDAAQAARALASLRAELRYRERRIAALGARDIDGATGLPRLVIVVDEFAAMLADHPDLHALFADIAARGRSLGVHLVLCTQRPAGVVRDAVLANADLRVSLRVNNRADSSAVVGSDAAAAIPARHRGRGILALPDGPPRAVQFAIASPDDVEAVARRWPDSGPARRPWCEPLPPFVPVHTLAPDSAGIPLGLADLPDEQRIATATWHPARDGHLLLLGAPGSGKSTALETIAAGAGEPLVEWIPAAPDAAWDALARLEGRSADERLVIVDDLDSLLSRLSPDHRVVFVERLGRVLRDGPSRGIRVALAAQRLTADAQSLASLAPARLLLGQASRQDHVLAGGEGAHYLDRLAPGGGHWRGKRMQFASGAARRPPDAPAIVDEPRDRPLAIVSPTVGLLASRLGHVVRLADLGPDLAASLSSPNAPIVLGDVDQWQSRWGAIAALRAVADILFEGCTIADFRALTRSRELPPPLDPADPTLCWLLNDDGSASRARLPSPSSPAIPDAMRGFGN